MSRKDPAASGSPRRDRTGTAVGVILMFAGAVLFVSLVLGTLGGNGPEQESWFVAIAVWSGALALIVVGIWNLDPLRWWERRIVWVALAPCVLAIGALALGLLIVPDTMIGAGRRPATVTEARLRGALMLGVLAAGGVGLLVHRRRRAR